MSTPDLRDLALSPRMSPIPTPPGPRPPSAATAVMRNPQADSDLLRLPAELLHKVLTDLGIADPSALAAVAGVCRDLHAFVYRNPDAALWRNVLLNRYDDPRTSGSTSVAWRDRVQDRAFLERIFSQPADCGEWTPPRSTILTASFRPVVERAEEASELAPHLDRICKALLDLYLDLPPRDPSTEDTGPNSFFAAPPTRNGPLLNRALRSEAYNKMYLDQLTHTASSSSGSSSASAGSDSSAGDTDPIATRTRSHTYTPPHALPPTFTLPLRDQHRVTGNPTLARLHALVPAELDPDVEQHRQHRGFLRELVYGCRHYRRDNDYAPLSPDGTVDWHLVNAIGTVMMLNAIDALAIGEEVWRPAVAPMSNGIEAVRGLGFGNLARPPHLADGEVWDWAGVAGRWFGSYAFLDYADWVILNHPHLVEGRRSLDLSRYMEAAGDLMELHLTASHDPLAAETAHAAIDGVRVPLASLDTPLPTSSALPPVYFYGRSQQAVAAPMSFVRGVARLTADEPPEVRWTMVIRYGGEDRWKIEGVQVGGRQSRRGFFGIWTDAGKEEMSPNGPVWYWKKDPPASRPTEPPAPITLSVNAGGGTAPVSLGIVVDDA